MKGKDAYYIGVFLVGAYQEILGDMHNLFGDTNAVHVTVDDKGYSIDQVIDGETVAEVLDYVQYGAYTGNLGDQISEGRKNFCRGRKRIPL